MSFYIALILLAFNVSAEECARSYAPQELSNLALKNEILFELKENDISSVDGFISDVSKIYNPDFEHFTTTGDQFGQQNVTTESRIWFNLQLAGKREKRADVFRSEKKIGQAQLEIMKLKFRKEILLAILRLKQINKQALSIKNLIEVTNGFINRYKKISHLAPEQKVEKGSLEISLNDLILLDSKIDNEHQLIKRFFERALREDCNINLAMTNTSSENNWPAMSSSDLNLPDSPTFRLAQLGVEKSQFEFTREDAKKYPDLKVGPVWQLNRLGSQEYSTFGLSFIVPIPVFDLNQGLRQVSAINVRRSKLEADFTQQQISRDFIFHKENYLRLRKQILFASNHAKYESLMKEYRALFERGLISIPNFLSYKREFLNFLTEVHEVETLLAGHLIELYHLNNQSTQTFIPEILNL